MSDDMFDAQEDALDEANYTIDALRRERDEWKSRAEDAIRHHTDEYHNRLALEAQLAVARAKCTCGAVMEATK